MLARTGDHRSGVGQRKLMDPVGSVDLLWVALVNDDRGLITTPVVVVSPLERKTQARSAKKFHNIRSTCSPGGCLGTSMEKGDVPNSREYTSRRIPFCSHNHSPSESIHRRRKTNTASVRSFSAAQQEGEYTETAGRRTKVIPSRQAGPNTSSNPRSWSTKEPGHCCSTSRGSAPSRLPQRSEP